MAELEAFIAENMLHDGGIHIVWLRPPKCVFGSSFAYTVLAKSKKTGPIFFFGYSVANNERQNCNTDTTCKESECFSRKSEFSDL